MIIEEREVNVDFHDFYDFCERVDPQVLNKRALDSLIKAGGFDALGHPRKGLLFSYEQIVEHTLARRRERDQGVMSLFDDVADSATESFDERTPIPDLAFDKSQQLAFEKEMLGLYVSDHPLMGVEHLLAKRAECTIAELRDSGESPSNPNGHGGQNGQSEMRLVGGVVTNLSRKYTKKGDLMAVFVLEDLQSAIEVMVFPKTMTDHGYKLVEDAVVVLRGRLDTRDDVPKIICSDITPIELEEGGSPIHLHMPAHGVEETKVDALKKLLLQHPGDSPVFLHLGETVLRLPGEFNVNTAKGLAGELREMLGANGVEL